MHEHLSHIRRLVGLCALMMALIGPGAAGQQASSEPRRYKSTWGDVPLRSAPRPDAKEIGKVPAGTVVEAIEKQDYWVKVKVKNTVGWAASTAMERLMETPAPDVEFVHSRYKIIGNTYRYFFGIRNSGLANYTEPVTLSLYNKDKVIFTQTYTFASTPIRASGVKCPPIVYTDLSGLFCKVTAPVLSTAHHDIPATGGALPPVVKW